MCVVFVAPEKNYLISSDLAVVQGCLWTTDPFFFLYSVPAALLKLKPPSSIVCFNWDRLEQSCPIIPFSVVPKTTIKDTRLVVSKNWNLILSSAPPCLDLIFFLLNYIIKLRRNDSLCDHFIFLCAVIHRFLSSLINIPFYESKIGIGLCSVWENRSN